MCIHSFLFSVLVVFELQLTYDVLSSYHETIFKLINICSFLAQREFILTTENSGFFFNPDHNMDIETYDRLIYIVLNLIFQNKLLILSIFCPLECNDGTYGFNCKYKCTTCNNTSCERFDGNCTGGCIKDYEGHQCQLSG